MEKIGWKPYFIRNKQVFHSKNGIFSAAHRDGRFVEAFRMRVIKCYG